MALHPDSPDFPHAILAPELRWFPADEALLSGAGLMKAHDIVVVTPIATDGALG